MKWKGFYTAMKTIKSEGQPKELGKVTPYHISDEVLISKIYTKHEILNKKIYDLLKQWMKDWINIYQNKTYKWPTGIFSKDYCH